jgi:hypothetical protein
MRPLSFILSMLAFAFFSCAKPLSSAEENSPCIKGQLVKKGICGHLVIAYVSGDSTGLQLNEQWKDTTTGKVYSHVFTVANPCDFPDNLNEGAQVDFSVVNKGLKQCSLCEAYTPVPPASNHIKLSCSSEKAK